MSARLAPICWKRYLQHDSVPFFSLTSRFILGEQGWRSGESARLPPMCPGFDSRTRRHMWVEFVVGSLPCSERFSSGYSGFPLSSKKQHFQIPIRSWEVRTLLNEFFELLGAPWVNKLHYTTFLWHFCTDMHRKTRPVRIEIAVWNRWKRIFPEPSIGSLGVIK